MTVRVNSRVDSPVDCPVESWTPLGVRLRRRRRSPGPLDFLFLPGGPGIGSESLAELVDSADLPGTSWMVDLPGDGSNVDAPGAPADPYPLWPHVFLEAVAAVECPVAVGHWTGGEYLLSIPGLEDRLEGLVLISSAPDAGWRPGFEAMTTVDRLPAVEAATARYERDADDETLREIAVESAPWNFSAAHIPAGRELMGRMPYNGAAVEWSATHFDRSYVSAWWPRRLPTLIVSGTADRIVDQTLWNDPYYRGTNVDQVWIEDAGHWPWIERPDSVRTAFRAFADQLAGL